MSLRWEGRGGAGGNGDYAYPCAWPRPLGVEGVAHPQVQGGVEEMDPGCLRMSLPSPHALWRVTPPFPPPPTPSGIRSLHSRRRQGALTCRPLATSPICCCHLWWEGLLTLLSTTHTKGQCPFGKGCTSECWKDLTCPPSSPSWYSWAIHSLVSGVYAFGFLFMLPQLFLNYQLKTVAHLPWRAFMYKVQGRPLLHWCSRCTYVCTLWAEHGANHQDLSPPSCCRPSTHSSMTCLLLSSPCQRHTEWLCLGMTLSFWCTSTSDGMSTQSYAWRMTVSASALKLPRPHCPTSAGCIQWTKAE